MSCNCEIKWINREGNTTEDTNEAKYVAVCTTPFAAKTHFLCCEDHMQMGKGFSNWYFVPIAHHSERVYYCLAQKASHFLTDVLGA